MNEDFILLEKTYELALYPKRDIVLVRGENARVWDSEGREYIDCVVGHGVANLGHAHPVVVAAIREQAERLVTCSNLFYNDQRALLTRKLVEITPRRLTRVFLCNSGTESMEAAIKFARISTGRTEFVCAEGGFHGRTLGALSATFKPHYRTDFEPLLPGFHFVPFNDFDALQAKVTRDTAGVILEVVQGEGGVHPGRAEFFARVRELCDQTGALLIIDEIQSGFCRTGKWFACEHFDLQPDILCLAKAIAAGLPMGAVLCSDKVSLPVGKHGTTFGGNPLSCAAANAAIEVMQAEKLEEQAREKGAYFRTHLQPESLSKVREVRGLGLMLGIETVQEAQPLVLELQQAGVLVFSAGTHVIRVFPPLTIEYRDLDRVLHSLKEILK